MEKKRPLSLLERMGIPTAEAEWLNPPEETPVIPEQPQSIEQSS